jgi:CRISPR-associated protein Csm5
MKPFFERHRLKLTAITPIHIGSGEVFDPTEYTIDGNHLYLFDTLQFVSKLPHSERQKLLQISHNALQLQRFFKKHRKIAIEASHTTISTVPSIAEEFEKKLGNIVHNEGGRDKNVLNRLEIQAHIRTANQLYIPGSSIKGALKSAFFQYYLNKESDPEVAREKSHKGEYRFKDNWFGKFERDKFSKLKVGDASSNQLSSKVYWVVNKQRHKDDDKTSLAQRLECIVPGSELQTDLIFLKSGENRIVSSEKKFFEPFPFDANNFRIIVKNFYLPLLKKEIDWAKEHDGLIPLSVRNRMIKAYNQAMAKKGFVFKVGQHSGAEAMTLEGVREIKIPQAKPPKFVQEPYTYWLASEEKHGKNGSFMGWVYAEFIH